MVEWRTDVYAVRYQLYIDIKCIKCTKAFNQYCGHFKIVYASSGGLGGHLRYVTERYKVRRILGNRRGCPHFLTRFLDEDAYG